MEKSLQIQIKGKAPDGSEQLTIMEYIEVVREIEFTTNRMDSPGKLKFTCLEDGPIGIPEGSSVEYLVNGMKLFKGFVFTIERTRDGETSYTAYDQLRYLKSETIVQTGKIFILYDKAGELTLVEAKNWFTNTMVGDGSLVTDYTYKRDIDSDTYNRVKLVRKNEKSGRTDVYVHEDTDTIKKWGLLQYYDEVDENLNEAQIDKMCEAYLQYYNRVLQTLKLEAIGIPEIRAGMILPVKIGDIEDLAVSRLLLAEKVTQKWEGADHTMQIEVKSFEQLGGVSIV